MLQNGIVPPWPSQENFYEHCRNTKGFEIRTTACPFGHAYSMSVYALVCVCHLSLHLCGRSSHFSSRLLEERHYSYEELY